MKLFNVEFSPDRVVIDRKWEWVRVNGRRPHYHLPARVNGMYHLKTPEEMAQYIRDLLSDPTRRGFIKEGTLNIVMRTLKESPTPIFLGTITITGPILFKESSSSDCTAPPHNFQKGGGL